MNRLDQIISAARERVARSKQTANLRALERMADGHVPRGFRRRLAAMAQSSPAVIAELKKASPSKGVIRGSFHVAACCSACQERRIGALRAYRRAVLPGFIGEPDGSIRGHRCALPAQGLHG